MKLRQLWEDDSPYLDPNKLLDRRGAIAFIYGGEPPKLFYGRGDHGTIMDRPEYEKHLPAPDNEEAIYDPDILLGRISYDKTKLSVWNSDSDEVERLMPGAVDELLNLKLIVPSTIIMSPTYANQVTADNLKASTRLLSAQEQDKLALQRKLHVANWKDKDDILQQLGKQKVPSRPHPITTASRSNGLLQPGQKWWALHSESALV